jgi:choline kinase
MRVIVLAAGEGFQLDGFSKILLRHPSTGETILEQYRRLFAGRELTVVVGFRAVAVMQEAPELRYVYNSRWRLTGNAYSLGLALDDRPTIVLSSDFFVSENLVRRLIDGPPDAVVAMQRDNRGAGALNLTLDDAARVTAVYQGPVRRDWDPEAPGLMKISSPGLLTAWRRACLEQPNSFAVQNLSLDGPAPVRALVCPANEIDEINTPDDYLRLLERERTLRA